MLLRVWGSFDSKVEISAMELFLQVLHSYCTREELRNLNLKINDHNRVQKMQNWQIR